jgi:hypothetical protein
MIKATSPELVYQLYLLDKVIETHLDELSNAKQYIANLARHMKFVLFAFVVKALQASNASFGSEEFANLLQAEMQQITKGWRNLVKRSIDQINVIYRGENKKYKKRVGQPLSVSNFFKSQTYIDQIIGKNKPLPQAVRTAARAVL